MYCTHVHIVHMYTVHMYTVHMYTVHMYCTTLVLYWPFSVELQHAISDVLTTEVCMNSIKLIQACNLCIEVEQCNNTWQNLSKEG